MPAFAAEVARQDPAVQARFGEGLEDFFGMVERRLPDTVTEPAERRARAVAIVSALVGGLALARATARTAPDLSAEILTALRGQLDGFTG